MKDQKRARYSLLTIAQGEKILKEILSDSLLIKTQVIAWVADDHLNLVYANKNFHQYFSLNDHGTIQNIADKIPEEIMDSFCDDYLQILNGGAHQSKEVPIQTADGNKAIFHINMFPVQFGKKMVGGYAIKLENSYERSRLEHLNDVMEEIRCLSKELVTPSLKKKGLVENIKKLIADINVCKAVIIEFTHDHQTYPISNGKKVTIFRIIQEQLRNILKYGKATSVEIILSLKSCELQILIKDNGIGLAPQKK